MRIDVRNISDFFQKQSYVITMNETFSAEAEIKTFRNRNRIEPKPENPSSIRALIFDT